MDSQAVKHYLDSFTPKWSIFWFKTCKNHQKFTFSNQYNFITWAAFSTGAGNPYKCFFNYNVVFSRFWKGFFIWNNMLETPWNCNSITLIVTPSFPFFKCLIKLSLNTILVVYMDVKIQMPKKFGNSPKMLKHVLEFARKDAGTSWATPQLAYK